MTGRARALGGAFDRQPRPGVPAERVANRLWQDGVTLAERVVAGGGNADIASLRQQFAGRRYGNRCPARSEAPAWGVRGVAARVGMSIPGVAPDVRAVSFGPTGIRVFDPIREGGHP